MMPERTSLQRDAGLSLATLSIHRPPPALMQTQALFLRWALQSHIDLRYLHQVAHTPGVLVYPNVDPFFQSRAVRLQEEVFHGCLVRE